MEELTQHRTGVPVRLRFVLGKGKADIVVPAEVPVGDLLPTVLAQFGPEQTAQAGEHEGWIVQRLGESALDEERTPAELNLLDGEALYLRPRAGQLPPIDYDDLVDGVGEQIRDRPGSWSPGRTRVMLLVGAAAIMSLGLLPLLGSGDPGLLALLAIGAAAALLGGAAALARAVIDPLAATVLAGVAALYAGAGVSFAFVAADPAATATLRWASAGVGALVALATGLAVVADSAVLFTGALTALVLLAVPLLEAGLASMSAADGAAIGLIIGLVVVLLAPGVAFRLSGMSLPMLPTNSEELGQDITPVPHEFVVDRATATMGYLCALYVGTAVAQSVLVLVMLSATGLFPTLLSAVVALLLLLRARHFTGTVPRWSVLATAAVATLTVMLRLIAMSAVSDRELLLWCPAVAIGVVLLVLSRTMPGRRLRPYWGRAADIGEALTAVAVVPLLLGVLNVYSFIRGVTG